MSIVRRILLIIMLAVPVGALAWFYISYIIIFIIYFIMIYIFH